jgi:hypothetical protein
MPYRSLFPQDDPRTVEDGQTLESVPFASRCPERLMQQPQRGFSRAALGRLLNGGHPIEAYCVTCDEFWAICLRDRVALADDLSAGKINTLQRLRVQLEGLTHDHGR